MAPPIVQRFIRQCASETVKSYCPEMKGPLPGNANWREDKFLAELYTRMRINGVEYGKINLEEPLGDAKGYVDLLWQKSEEETIYVQVIPFLNGLQQKDLNDLNAFDLIPEPSYVKGRLIPNRQRAIILVQLGEPKQDDARLKELTEYCFSLGIDLILFLNGVEQKETAWEDMPGM